MNTFGVEDIAQWINSKGELSNPKSPIEHILLDSRKYYSGSGYLFFALRGENHNGHQYIEDLYKEGVRNFVVESLPDNIPQGCNFLVVENSLKALQQVAKKIRELSQAQIVGITGSNGKTIVKEWLAQLLRTQFKVHKTPKSYNSQVGVPLAIWGLSRTDEVGVFEAGISKPNEMAHLQNILQPDIGIFTNIGSAHEEFFESREQKVREKLRLFKHSKKLIYCYDHNEIRSLIEEVKWTDKTICWSRKNRKTHLYIQKVEKKSDTSIIEGVYNGELLKVNIPFLDEASIENAIHVWLCGLTMSIDQKSIEQTFLKLEPVAMRLEMKSGLHGAILIDDVYNSDLESLKIALDFLKQQAQNRERIVVLSDILQSGLRKEKLYAKVAAILQDQGIDKCIAVGSDLKSYKNLFSSSAEFYDTTIDFLKVLDQYNWENKAVLIKGARSFKFERISKTLEYKSHETVLEIHLDRMVHNLNHYRSQLAEDVKIMAMVKAFSYGSGSYEVASLLEFHKVDYLAVAYTDEGVELRKAGIKLPIMVLNTEPASFDDALRYDLEPEIYNFRMLELFSKAVLRSTHTSFPIHLKLDTGMHRLGFTSDQVGQVANEMKRHPHLQLVSVFSHLAASDEAEHRDFTQKQIDLFVQICDELKTSLGNDFIRHIVNTAGISGFKNAHFDMVRLGIGLYGISSSLEERNKLMGVSELKASISQIKNIHKGETVGYGLSFIAPKDMTIAVITLGYADGLRRSLSNGVGRVWIKDQYYPIVGKVCMDMTMIDISNANLSEGDEVEIIGEHLSVYDLAEQMETIPYEVLTGISSRVKRVYYLE
jgi:alanine racemase